MTESEFTRWMVEELRKCNCICLAIVASAMQQPGIPDRWIAGKGLPGCWVEMKKGRNDLSLDQRLLLTKMHEHKVPYVVGRWLGHCLRLEDVHGKVLHELPFPLDKSRPAGVQIREALREAVYRDRQEDE